MSGNAASIYYTTNQSILPNINYRGWSIQALFVDNSNNFIYYTSSGYLSKLLTVYPYTNTDILTTSNYDLFTECPVNWAFYKNRCAIGYNKYGGKLQALDISGNFTLITGAPSTCGLAIYNDILYLVALPNNTITNTIAVYSCNLYPNNFSNPFNTTAANGAFTQVYSNFTGLNVVNYSPYTPGGGLCTFDTCGNLYITSFGTGVYVYPVGSTFNTNPTKIINSTNNYTSIVYSSYYNILYIYNYTTSSIDLYYTDGTLLKSNYIVGNATNSITSASTNSYSFPVQMTVDNVGNFYIGSNSSTLGIVYYTKILCFKEDTQILTINGYKLIQHLKKGDLVKTLTNGYKPIYKIGYSVLDHEHSNERTKKQLYKCSSENYPDLFEDLVITGCHNILVDEFKNDEEREEADIVNGSHGDCVTEDKYRLPAYVDKNASVYEVSGTYVIYHFALENEDYYMNYGVYANGLLVESTSKRFIDENTMTEIQ